MKVLPVSPRLKKYLQSHQLVQRFKKQIRFLEENPRHPSLRVELLEPKERGIYSFRVDLQFRALFIFRDDLKALEIIAITRHYR